MLFGFLRWEYVLVGIVGIAGAAVAVRMMRKGLSTLDDARTSLHQRIRQTTADIVEKNKSTPVAEQLALCAAAIRELVELDGDAATRGGTSVACEGGCVRVRAPGHCLHIRYAVRAAQLKGVERELHGEGQWLLACEDIPGEAAPGEAAGAAPLEAAPVRPVPAALRGLEPAPAHGVPGAVSTPGPPGPSGPPGSEGGQSFDSIDALLQEVGRRLGLAPHGAELPHAPGKGVPATRRRRHTHVTHRHIPQVERRLPRI